MASSGDKRKAPADAVDLTGDSDTDVDEPEPPEAAPPEAAVQRSPQPGPSEAAPPRPLQPARPIREVTLPGGVLDDRLLAEVDAIAQQSNCIGCDGKGLAAGIAAQFPWGCSYAGRRRMPGNKFAVAEDRAKPGTIDVRRGPAVLGFAPGTPLVINMFAQFEMGGPGKYQRVPFPHGVTDLAPQREQWFASCLEAIGQLPAGTKPARIAFPALIGCGLAGGDWRRYRGMLEEFARSNPDMHVTIALRAGDAPGGKGGGGRGGGRGGSGSGGGGRGSCFRCGQPGHWANACPSRGER